MDFHVGQIFGDYTVTGILGAGSMGHVYKVEHNLTQRTEVMKVLSAEFASDVQVKRFEREMRALARLSHQNIAALHNAIHSGKQLILLMEFIEGRTLESMFLAGRLPIDTGLGYIRQILTALAYAHQQGVVHRDVTPANVLVTAAGEVKLTDFGLSKSFGDTLLTNCGDILGSLQYMAPEQLKGVTQPDRRSDLYSVGAILYEHLTGQKPFGANRKLAPVLTDSEPEPQPPSLVEPSLALKWDPILQRALARNPEHRYQSAEEFLDAMGQLERVTVPEFSLPHLSKLALGAAVLAGVVVAVAASPAIKSLTPVASINMPSPRLHIAPPNIATSLAVPAPSAQQTEQPRRHQQHGQLELAHTSAPKSVVHSAKAIVIDPPPAIAIASRPAADPPPAPLPVPPEEVVAPPPAETASADASQATPQPKKTFWGKLNVFKKKKNADSADSGK